MWFTNSFSHSIGCLFILFIISFGAQKLFNLIQTHLFVFYFVACALGVISKKIIAKILVKEDFFYVFIWEFYVNLVSGLPFKSFIYFVLISVYGGRHWSCFILLRVVVQFPQHHLLKRLSFPHCIFLAPLLQINLPYTCGFIPGLSILFH